MESILLSVHVLVAIVITGLVLMQQGKGADAGASFGGGASQTVFGSSGSGNFLTRSTTWMTVIFFCTSLGLGIIARQKADGGVDEASLISGDIERLSSEQPTLVEDDFPEIPSVDSADDGFPDVDFSSPEEPLVEETPEDTVEEEEPAQ